MTLAVSLRSPETVMRLDRLGASHPTRLSFSRAVLRRAEAEGWRVTRPVWSMDADGFGHAVYRVHTGSRSYSLVAVSQALAPEARTDRVIAEAWDTGYVLYDGVPDAAAIERLRAQVPLQEAGRFTETELVLSRANKSVRLFDTVVALLAEGRQPEAASLDAVGYLMRTTAVYGNGKFGIADRDLFAERPELSGPFRAEMLTVWLIRAFTVDLAEHCAAQRAPELAVRLAPALRRRLGVGNSTGLGMAPFLVRHPILLHRWIVARESALARVRSLPTVEAQALRGFGSLLDRARAEARDWYTTDLIQADRITGLSRDLEALALHLEDAPALTWDDIHRWTEENLGLEAQERVVALLIEPQGDLVDDLADAMAADEGDGHALDGVMTCGALHAIIETDYRWALDHDGFEPSAQARFWYVSAEKLEPRLGERQRDEGAALEQPMTFGRDVAILRSLLRTVPDDASCRDLMASHPELRHVVRRVQVAARYPYAEIRDNLIDAAMRPIDLLRSKLAFFGATRFDPRSDRWLRISLFQDEPFPDELLSTRAAAA